MKKIIDFLSDPIILLIQFLIQFCLFFISIKFLLTYIIMAPIAATLIWLFNIEIYKKAGKNLPFYIKFLAFLFDILLWTNSLVLMSKIMLEEKEIKNV